MDNAHVRLASRAARGSYKLAKSTGKGFTYTYDSDSNTSVFAFPGTCKPEDWTIDAQWATACLSTSSRFQVASLLLPVLVPSDQVL